MAIQIHLTESDPQKSLDPIVYTYLFLFLNIFAHMCPYGVLFLRQLVWYIFFHNITAKKYCYNE